MEKREAHVTVMIGHYLPGPQVEFFHKEVSHDALHLAEAGGESCGLISEGFNEAGLVFLPEQSQNEGLLARLDDFMGSIHQDA